MAGGYKFQLNHKVNQPDGVKVGRAHHIKLSISS